jgi:hypothetical protein
MFYALPLQVDGYPLPQFVYWVSRKDVLSPAVADKLISFGSKCDSVQWFGVLSIDLFASPENFKVARYYSYSFAASSAGVDAFSLSWEGKNAYCAPSIALILRVIRKI